MSKSASTSARQASEQAASSAASESIRIANERLLEPQVNQLNEQQQLPPKVHKQQALIQLPIKV
ncbi:hypothetical protein QY880_02065 [Latilactobacillus sakei]